MGQRISYFKNNFHKKLRDLIFEHFAAFKQWYLNTDKFSVEEFNEPFGSEKVKTYLRLEQDFRSDIELLNKKLVDELTAEFVSCFCDWEDRGGLILEFFGPTMNKWRYNESHDLVANTGNKEFLTLWNYVTKGRSIKDNKAFDSYANDYKIGFLGYEEHRQLKSYIETYFGDLATIRDRYWTDAEKMQLQSAIRKSKDGSYSLSGHNPKSSGLEFVLMVLYELGDNNEELITGIE